MDSQTTSFAPAAGASKRRSNAGVPPDDRTNLSQQVRENLRELLWPEKLFATTIPRNIRLAEAPSHGKPAATYDPSLPRRRSLSRPSAGVSEAQVRARYRPEP